MNIRSLFSEIGWYSCISSTDSLRDDFLRRFEVVAILLHIIELYLFTPFKKILSEFREDTISQVCRFIMIETYSFSIRFLAVSDFVYIG